MLKISKNFAWWLLAVTFAVEAIISAMYELWFVLVLAFIGFLFSMFKYFGYRERGE